jgi:hypothetical protein
VERAYPTRSRMILEQKTNRQESWTHSAVSAAPQASGTWGHEVHTSLMGSAAFHLQSGEGTGKRWDGVFLLETRFSSHPF